MKKILFVCLGNICRSPLAQGIFEKFVKELNLEKEIEIDSAGLIDYHAGELPNIRMRKTALSHNYELTHHSRIIKPEDFYNFDLILIMDNDNLKRIKKFAPNKESIKKIKKLTTYSIKYNVETIPDPYYGNREDFEYALKLTEDACKGLIYQETLQYIYNKTPMFQKIGAGAYKPGLEHIIALDKIFNAPHSSYKTIHIAGTNGKGSVSHMTASILQEAGYKVGLYTSPHLKDFRERIKINGEIISRQDVLNFVSILNKETPENLHPSFFEITTEMAFYCFKKYNVDIAIIETGLGGRLDSTNIIKPIACAITNITKDHTAQLGNTIELIAGEKAGIIKDNIPLAIGKMFPQAKEIICNKAKEKNSKITSSKDLENKAKEYLELCQLKGWYQKENIPTTLALTDIINKQGIKISEENIKNGLLKVITNTGLHGRWETLSTNPTIICDTGHNEAGIKFISSQLTQLIKTKRYKKLHIVMGMVKDKDVKTVLSLMPVNATYYFTRAKIERAMDEKEFAKIGSLFNLKGKSYSDSTLALQAAKENAASDDLIFIGGSTYLVAEII